MDNGISHPEVGGFVVERAESMGLKFSPEQKKAFLHGCVTPDVAAKKKVAHFYGNHRERGWRAPDLALFRSAVEAAGGWTLELLGVYVHLAADVQFFRTFVAEKKSDGSIQSEDGTTWPDGDTYKKKSLYEIYKANRVVPYDGLEDLVQLIWEAEPEETKLSELTLAGDWKKKFLNLAIPPEGFRLTPTLEGEVKRLRNLVDSVAEELVADEWFMAALRKALGA